MNDDAAAKTRTVPGGFGEVFTAFLRLGLTSFGGPIAHLGYFREDIVVRRRWLDEKTYRGSDRAVAVPAGTHQQQGRYRHRAAARRLSRRARRMGRFHAAFGSRARPVRLWRVGRGRCTRRRMAARAQGRRRGGGGAGGARHDADPGAGPRARHRRGRRRRDRAGLAVRLGAGGRDHPRRRRWLYAAGKRGSGGSHGAAARGQPRRRHHGARSVLRHPARAAAGCRRVSTATHFSCSKRSTAPARWCSGAGTWCCRCCRPRWCRPAG